MNKLTFVSAMSIALSTTSALAQEAVFEEVAPGVYSYDFFFYNTLVVVGENGVLVTDPANDFRAAKMLEAIRGVTDLPITHVALTHEHYDHAGGADVFEGAEIVAHENVQDVLSMSTLFKMPTVTQDFEDTQSIDLGGISVDMIHLGHGDGTGTAIIHVPAADVVFSADMYQPKGFTEAIWKEDTNMVGVRSYLNKMVELDPAYAINSHQSGNSVEDLKENAELINKMYDTVQGALETAMEEGGPEAAYGVFTTLPQEIKMPEYAEWENYETGLPNYARRMALSIFHGG